MAANQHFVVINNAQVHQVEGGVQRLLCAGDLVLVSDDSGAVSARVGDTTWRLGRHLPALKAASTIYSFGLEGTRDTYYCLVLPPDAPASSLAALERVLSSSCAFSTVRQVEAAHDAAAAAAPPPQRQQRRQQQQQQQPEPAAAADACAAAGGAAAANGHGRGGGAGVGGNLGGGADSDDAMSGVDEEDTMEAEEVAARGAAALAAATAAVAAGRRAQEPPGGAPSSPERRQREQQQQQQLSAAERVASGILVGGCVVAGLVRRASGAASDAVARFTESRMAAAPRADPPAHVPSHVQQGLQVAAAVASGAAVLTGHLAAAVGDASYALALRIADAHQQRRERRRRGGGAAPGGGAAARRHGPRRGGAREGGGGGGERRRSALKTVGAAGLLAYVQVYDALEEAAKQVLAHSAEASAAYIGYKYGPEAAAAAERGVPLAQDVVQAATNVTRLAASRALVSHEAQRSAATYLHEALNPSGAPPPPAAAFSRAAAAAAAPAHASWRPPAPPPAPLEMLPMPAPA
ncbi:MAG: senescence-associated protein-domain-containing protein [Monoraphidium minutum]|nr:MAG: senescence-associated protein-domain-containing protein [Monoraphidium minutum]